MGWATFWAIFFTILSPLEEMRTSSSFPAAPDDTPILQLQTSTLDLQTPFFGGKMCKKIANHRMAQHTSITLASESGLPDFSQHNIPKRGKMYQITIKLPNGRYIFQMGIKISNIFHSKVF
jgi:hypothetical protein